MSTKRKQSSSTDLASTANGDELWREIDQQAADSRQMAGPDDHRMTWQLLTAIEDHHRDVLRIERDVTRPEASRVADAKLSAAARDGAVSNLVDLLGAAEAKRLIAEDLKTGDVDHDRQLALQVDEWVGVLQHARVSQLASLRPQGIPRQQQQQEAIVNMLREMGHNPMALPRVPQGRRSEQKREVQERLGLTNAQMAKAWQSLHKAGRIRYAED